MTPPITPPAMAPALGPPLPPSSSSPLLPPESAPSLGAGWVATQTAFGHSEQSVGTVNWQSLPSGHVGHVSCEVLSH